MQAPLSGGSGPDTPSGASVAAERQCWARVWTLLMGSPGGPWRRLPPDLRPPMVPKPHSSD